MFFYYKFLKIVVFGHFGPETHLGQSFTKRNSSNHFKIMSCVLST